MEETPISFSTYAEALARRLFCRDHNDLWDHLFELRGETDPDSFFADLAGFCALARQGEGPQSGDTLAREAAMLHHIRAARDEFAPRPVLVLTGGFHTPALAADLAAGTVPPPPDSAPAQNFLIAYSHAYLDQMAGYAAGMAAPGYYARLWESGGALAELALSLLSELAEQSRTDRAQPLISTADVAAAYEQALRLARLRGHAGPGREDVRDAVASCFIKGSRGQEGKPVLEALDMLLRGDASGRVPARAGQPPILDDFRRRVEAAGLEISGGLSKPLRLDLYRDERDRQRSRLFHALGFLNVPFAQYGGGPDFVAGGKLSRLTEDWRYGWSPTVDAHLIDAAAEGDTVAEACIRRLRREAAQLDSAGQGRGAAPALALLMRACRMGLHGEISGLLGLLRRKIRADTDIGGLAAALVGLQLLHQAREPLGGRALSDLPGLALEAWQRACHLLPDLATLDDRSAGKAVGGLSRLREGMVAGRPALDPRPLETGLAYVLSAATTRPMLKGAAAGMLYGLGGLPPDGLADLAAGHLGGTGDAAERAGFISGLMATARESIWQIPALLEKMNAVVAGWSEDEFLDCLPVLRLAFSSLTPRETDRVARLVADLLGGRPLGALRNPDISEAEALAAARVAADMRAVLIRDHLGAWLPEAQS
jgi:hypothetical protein